MTSDAPPNLYLQIYSDINPEDAFHIKKPLLAHYTSMDVLEQMLRNSELWFSNPLYMNDLQEVRESMRQGADQFFQSQELAKACQTPEKFESLRQYFHSFMAEFFNVHLVDIYIFCLSEHSKNDNDGKLSMWRGYGGNGAGAAIVFDAAKINLNQNSPIIITKVTYGSDSDRKEWLANKILQIAKILQTTTGTDDDLKSAAFNYFHRIKIFSLATKHKGFAEENEWRAVYLRELDKKEFLVPRLTYFNGSRGLEPKLKFKIAPIEGLTDLDLSLSRLTDRIILGPSQSYPFAKAMLDRMLISLGMPEITGRVVASTIPFRA